MKSKLKVGVSSCLLGEKVRWNGKDKRDAVLIDELNTLFEYVSVCPEVEVGMGVPREPVQLIGDINEQKMQEVETGKDWTQPMVAFSEAKVLQLLEQGICGFIFKSHSPSCGTKGIPVHNDEVLPEEVAGLFAQAIMKHAPALPIIEEYELRNKDALEKFISQVRCVDGNTNKL
jgi:uncharacterized protein YbbK (DUF523 family)